MRDSTHTPRKIATSPVARSLVLSTMVAALGAPAAQADWTAAKTLTRPPLFDGFRMEAAANAKGVEAFAWKHTTRTFRHDPHGRSGYLKYIKARTRLPDGRLEPTRTVSRKNVIVGTPLVGVDRRGTTTVVWQESRRGSPDPFVMVAVARKSKRFGPGLALGRTAPDGDLTVGPAVVVAPSGAAIVAWIQNGRMVAVRRPAGRCSARSARLCFGSARKLGADRPVASPAVAIGPDGKAYVAFATNKPAMRLASSRGRYRFRPTQRLSPVGQPATAPSVAAGTEGAVVAWRRAGPDSALEGSYGPILTAVRYASGEVSAAQTVDPSADASAPVVRMTAQDEAVLTWTRGSEDESQVLAAVRPPSGGFGAPVLIAQSGRTGRLAVDHYGNAIIAYYSSGRISASRRPPRGSFGPVVHRPGAVLYAFLAAGGKFTASWISNGGAVRLSDLTF